jgi:mannose-1-phosphate guanylyltransferase / phosphomannomutase
MEQLAAIVPVLHAELGVRIDPGGEKMFIVDDRGRRLSDLQTLAALTELSMRCNNGGTVAVPVSSPRAFEEIARRYNGTIIRTRVNLGVLMQTASANRDYLLLGDGSGNVIFPSFYPIADALFAMVKLMELLALQNVRLSTVVDQLPAYYMERAKVPCRWENKGRVMRLLNEQYADRATDQIDGIKIEQDQTWVLIQPDTEGPFFHVIAEGDSSEQARSIVASYVELVLSLQ